MTILCRIMQAQDIPSLLEIERDFNPSPWNHEHFKNCLQPPHEAWVLEKQGQILGYAIMRTVGGEGEILNIAMHAKHRRKGLAQFLLNYLFDLAKKKKVKSLFLEVRTSNLPAQSLYNKLGFNQIAVRKNYYPAKGSREDALIFARELDV